MEQVLWAPWIRLEGGRKEGREGGREGGRSGLKEGWGGEADLMESWREPSNCRISRMRKLKGIPIRDSSPNGSSECF